MYKRRGLFRLIALLAVLALVVAACDDAEPEPEPVDTTVPEPVDTTEPEPVDTTEPEPEPEVEIEPISLMIGTILPQTGALAPIIDALEEPIRMAADEINADFPGLISLLHVDSGTDPAVASENVDQLLTGEFHAIIGAAASGVSTAIVDKVQDAEVVMCSPSNTAASLNVFEPYYHRTAPSDDLQGPTLGDLIIADGMVDVAVTWRSDEYGVGFGVTVAEYLEASGLNVTYSEGYDHEAASFADLMESVAASGAEALAMITFAEGGQMALDAEGRFDGQIYVADGFVDTVGEEQLGGRVDLLDGIRGTYPSATPAVGEPTFAERYAAYTDAPTIFSAHAYDCLVTIALAAQKAQSNDPTVFVNEMVGVTGAPGTKCSFFAECFALLEAGEDIDYDGASGPLDFAPNGQPTSGTYDLFEFHDDGTRTVFDQVFVEE